MSKPNIFSGINCNIHSSVVFGEEPFWYDDFKQKEGKYGIDIGDNVDIRAGTTIHRGMKRDTKIGYNTKIDANVHIAHDVQIGRHCVIGAGVMFGGGVTVGDNCEIWMGAILHQNITLADNSVVGANSYCRQNLGSNEVFYGGKSHWKNECKKYNKALR